MFTQTCGASTTFSTDFGLGKSTTADRVSSEPSSLKLSKASSIAEQAIFSAGDMVGDGSLTSTSALMYKPSSSTPRAETGW